MGYGVFYGDMNIGVSLQSQSSSLDVVVQVTISPLGKAIRSAKSGEVLVECYHCKGGSPDILKGSGQTGSTGVAIFSCANSSDPNYLHYGPGTTYKIVATHLASGARVSQRFDLAGVDVSGWFIFQNIQPVVVESSGSAMPATFSQGRLRGYRRKAE
jgi:hypothetical protein